MPLCGALLNVRSIVVCFTHFQLKTRVEIIQYLLKFNLSRAHEECVELVRIALEQESLGSVLVQHSNRIVHLQKRCNHIECCLIKVGEVCHINSSSKSPNLNVERHQDPVQFLFDFLVHDHLASVVLQLVGA